MLSLNKFTLNLGLLVLLIFPAVIHSQETTTASNTLIPKFGARLGINFSNLSTENATDNILPGLCIGMFVKLPITKYFAFQPEVNFSMKGAKVDYANPFVAGSATYAFNYLEVPLIGVINFTDNLSIHGGPYAAYLISGSTKNNSSANIFDFENNINPDNYERLDLGVVLGAALNVGRVGLGVRYSRGFTTIGKESTVSGTLIRFPDAINSVFTMFGAISF
jgi:hypothetical protein